MEKQEKKNNKALYVALAVLLVVALLAGSLGGVWYRKTRGDVLVEQSNSLHKSLAAGFTDVKITNKTSAVEAVQSVKEKLGLNDAEEELEVVGTQKINGDKYYRMQQYHKGIPVYGRNVVVGADEDGNALSLTTNYEPIGGELSTDPSVDEATVKKNIEKQLKKVSKAETTKAAKTTTTTAETTQEETTEKPQKETTKKTEKETTTEAPSEETTEEATKAASGNFLIDALEQSNLVFYDFLKKGEAVLSYALNVKDDTTGLWKAIVDAKTGEVLDMLPMTFTSTATVEDSAGNAFTASYKSAQKKYVLEDETLKTFIATFKGADSTSGAPCIIIESEDNVFGNTATEKDLDYNKAARFYRTVTKVQNRFKSLYGAKADNLLVAMYNDGNDYGNNGYASSDTMTGTPYIKDGTPIGIISIGTLKDVETIDLIAHEYMHRVEQNKVGLLYRSESGALMEAYSDIFGELLEADINGTADWKHSGIRSLADPLETDDPAVYYGDNWGNTGADYDHGYVHQNSTVISHAAYLMRTGVEGSAALNDQQLGRLFMEALNRFVQNESFQQAASAIYATAQDQARYGRLSNAQVETVAKAFSEVGLSVTEEPQEETTAPKAGLLNKKQELTVPKTFKVYTRDGLEQNQYNYTFDLEKKTLNITSQELKNEFGRVPMYWAIDAPGFADGLVTAEMIKKHPELVILYNFEECFPTPFIFAYSDLIKNGYIETIVDSEGIYTFDVVDGLLYSYTFTSTEGNKEQVNYLYYSETEQVHRISTVNGDYQVEFDGDKFDYIVFGEMDSNYYITWSVDQELPDGTIIARENSSGGPRYGMDGFSVYHDKDGKVVQKAIEGFSEPDSFNYNSKGQLTWFGYDDYRNEYTYQTIKY